MRSFSVFFLIAVTMPLLHGQVFEVNGGSSSLFEAQGGTLSARGESYNASLGAGVIAGQFVGGANLAKAVGKTTYIFGDDYIRFVLPTDIFDSSHYLVAVGAGVKTKVQDIDVLAFAGATSNSFASPLFNGVRAENPVGILFLKKRLTAGLDAYSHLVFSKQQTAIGSLDWQPADKLKFGIAGGCGAGKPYGATSFDLSRPWIIAKASYIEASSQFHRVIVETPLMSEPDRENILVTLRPVKYFSFGGGRQNFLSPLTNSQTNINSQTNVRSTVDQFSGDLRILGTGLSASFYHSTYLKNSNNANAYTATRDFSTRLHTTASYLESRPENAQKTQSFLANFTEVVTPRLNVTEVLNRSHGQTTCSFGGGFLSNVVSISADYQTYYVPERKSAGFEQALILDLQLHLFRGISLHGATFVAPDGRVRYTADARAIATRPGAPSGNAPFLGPSLSANLVRGTVVDTEGRPVSGASVMIDEVRVYTNEEGQFEMRERKAHVHELKVLGDQFLDGFAYRVVSAPTTVRGGAENDPGAVVVVERILAARK